MISVKQLTLGKSVLLLLLLCLSLQHRSVHSQPLPDDLRDSVQDIVMESNQTDRMPRTTCPEQDDCTEVDESELAVLYNSRYPGAEFYSSCLYLLHYIVPVRDRISNTTTMLPRYVGLVSTEGRCVNLEEIVHDPICLSTSHPHHKSTSYCSWSYSLRYLGETFFPRYILEMKCKNFESCRAEDEAITVRVLEQAPGCTEGFENWSSSNTTTQTVVAGCSCRHQ